MKKLLINLVFLYQKVPTRMHKLCRHTPSCSQYMIEALNQYGITKGLKLGLKRIWKCRPHGTIGYDPVPKKEETV